MLPHPHTCREGPASKGIKVDGAQQGGLAGCHIPAVAGVPGVSCQAVGLQIRGQRAIGERCGAGAWCSMQGWWGGRAGALLEMVYGRLAACCPCAHHPRSCPHGRSPKPLSRKPSTDMRPPLRDRHRTWLYSASAHTPKVFSTVSSPSVTLAHARLVVDTAYCTALAGGTQRKAAHALSGCELARAELGRQRAPSGHSAVASGRVSRLERGQAVAAAVSCCACQPCNVHPSMCAPEPLNGSHCNQ